MMQFSWRVQIMAGISFGGWMLNCGSVVLRTRTRKLSIEEDFTILKVAFS
jgi:hypothetical protein